MEIQLKPGLKAQVSESVGASNTASFWKSGGLDVYATPAMAALMERAAVTAVQSLLPAGFSTVGTSLDIRHLAASLPGAKIIASAELTAADGRRLEFAVAAWETGPDGLPALKIGEGTHGRFIIENEKFLQKARSRGPSGAFLA
jgi:predicted thioesterase